MREGALVSEPAALVVHEEFARAGSHVVYVCERERGRCDVYVVV